MLRAGDRVSVRATPQLERAGLAALAGRKGSVARALWSGGLLVGAFVDFGRGARAKRRFVPAASLEGPDEVNAARVAGLLRSFPL